MFITLLKSLLGLNKPTNTPIANDPMEEYLIRTYRPDLVKGLEILTKPVPIKYK
jgi:hypothetical protein|tara:strand:+ start:230 stop:391 length:162 start_codon:yes stop_codon:yes gene_type:complete